MSVLKTLYMFVVWSVAEMMANRRRLWLCRASLRIDHSTRCERYIGVETVGQMPVDTKLVFRSLPKLSL